MKVSNTSERLQQILRERNLKQIDIINLAEPYCKLYRQKLGRNDLSQFISGKVNPGQWKLTILGLALNISELWLMGYDVPRERSTISEVAQTILTDHEAKVITAYRDQPEVQPEVDTILGIKEKAPSEDGATIRLAAYDGSDDEPAFTSQDEIDAAPDLKL